MRSGETDEAAHERGAGMCRLCTLFARIYTQIAHLRPFLHTYPGAKTTPCGEVLTPGPPLLGRLAFWTACLRRPLLNLSLQYRGGHFLDAGARSRDWWPFDDFRRAPWCALRAALV